MAKKRWFLLVQSALCAVTAIILSAAVIRIYKEGSAWQAAGHPSDWIYTREKVIAGMLPALPTFIAALVMTVVGLVRGIADERADEPVKDIELMRNLVCARVAVPSDEMKRERALQKKYLAGGWGGYAACMIPVLLYLSDGSHFAQTDAAGLEQAITSLAAWCVPWTVAAFALLILANIMAEKSMGRETAAASERIRTEKAEGGVAPERARRETAAASERIRAEKAEGGVAPERAHLHYIDDRTEKRRRVARYVLMAAAACFIVLGIMNGSMRDVLIKAVKICTECVGLG